MITVIGVISSCRKISLCSSKVPPFIWAHPTSQTTGCLTLQGVFVRQAEIKSVLGKHTGQIYRAVCYLPIPTKKCTGR